MDRPVAADAGGATPHTRGTGASEPPREHRFASWTPVLGALLFALALGLLEAWTAHVYRARIARPLSWWRAIGLTVPSWLVQAALAWPIYFLVRRFRLRRGRWLVHLPVHVAASGLFTIAGATGTVLVGRLIGFITTEPIHAAVVRLFFTYLPYWVLVYWTIVGMLHAREYHRESEQRERERVALAESLTEARLQALRSQLNPHFLFNTLNAISTLALQGRNEQAAAMVAALGDLMRACIDERLANEVPLAQELELLERYLDIQRIRMADWLSVELDVDPGALDVLVPTLVLQPLVENAIVHGPGGDGGRRRIRLACAVSAGALTVRIEDAGQGAGAADAGQGAGAADEGVEPVTAAPGRVGVGLGNTRARLEQLHPGRHAFEAGPSSAGWRVTMRIPAHRAPATQGPAASSAPAMDVAVSAAARTRDAAQAAGGPA